MAKQSAKDAHPRAHYTDATEQAFRRAVEKLKTSLPTRHTALVVLVDAGRFDDLDSIVAVLEESGT
jgi:hypothetical protein